jgi:predicted ATP-binding protein involved in virulence
MKYIHLSNYRCFKDLRIDFAESSTLLIGDNASGKTSVLAALRSALSSFFTGYSDENTRFIGLSQKDFRRDELDETLLNFKPVELSFNLFGHEAMLSLISEKSRQSTRTATRSVSVLKEYATELKNDLFDEEKRQRYALPLIASFATDDIHIRRKLKIDLFKRYVHKPSFGYYECLLGSGLFPYWTKRMLVLNEGGKGEIELEGIRRAVQRALGADGCGIITDMDVRAQQGKIYYTGMDGREMETDFLSDGYARLLNIVVDLSFRCMLLNKAHYGVDACNKTEGVVLIDEIDLHLHPTLQANVMKGLRKAFPKVCFIISSHAPMVMSGIENDGHNRILQLSYDKTEGYSCIEREFYGMDVNSIIETAMEIAPRDKEVDERLSRLFDLIDADDVSAAKELLKQLKEDFGHNLPELSKAEILLNFTLGDDD